MVKNFTVNIYYGLSALDDVVVCDPPGDIRGCGIPGFHPCIKINQGVVTRKLKKFLHT